MRLIGNLDVIHTCNSWYRLWFNDTLLTEKRLAFTDNYYDGIFFGVDVNSDMHCVKFEVLSDNYDIVVRKLDINNECVYTNTSPLMKSDWKYHFKI